MARNSTLGEFSGGEEDKPSAIEPVHRWSPTEIDCPRCGTPVQGRWLEGGSTGRCSDCKEW